MSRPQEAEPRTANHAASRTANHGEHRTENPATRSAQDSRTARSAQPVRAGRRAWLAVAVAMFAVAWVGNEFTPLLVLYKRLEGLSTGTVDVLLGAYVVGIVPALLLGGPLSDRLGRKPLLVPAPLIAIAGSLVLALGHAHVPLLVAGRMLSGVALGLVMAVGTSWVRELSTPPYDPAADAATGARRAALALTVGFGLGAAAAAALAQWGPAPAVTPYLLNIAVTAVPAVLLLRAPETRPRAVGPQAVAARRPLREDLRIPSAGRARFWLVVAPMAPWVFGCAASAYAILPTVTTHLADGWDVAYAGLLCLLGLATGATVQQAARGVVGRDPRRAVLAGLVLAAAGLALAALALHAPSLWLTVPASVVLGAAYGLLMVSGLTLVQLLAEPDDLAGLTAVFYALTYLGFFVPAILAVLSVKVPYAAMMAAGALLALGCLVVVASSSRGGARPAPAGAGERPGR